MSKPDEQRNSKAPGHFENQGRRRQASGASAPDREERHQETRETAPTDQERRSGSNAGGAERAQSERSTLDREERIRNRAYRYWEEGGRQEGQATEHWHRAAQDLDREDAELQRTGADGAREAGRDRS